MERNPQNLRGGNLQLVRILVALHCHAEEALSGLLPACYCIERPKLLLSTLSEERPLLARGEKRTLTHHPQTLPCEISSLV